MHFLWNLTPIFGLGSKGSDNYLETMANKRENIQDDQTKVQDQIQENLRALYDETLDEALPDKLLALLKKLESQDQEK